MKNRTTGVNVFINKEFTISHPNQFKVLVDCHCIVYIDDKDHKWKVDVVEVLDIKDMEILGKVVDEAEHKERIIKVFKSILGLDLFDMAEKSCKEYFDKYTPEQLLESVGLKVIN